MQMSEIIDKIAPAFVAAQHACNGAKKASNNPHFKSKYADLSAVWDACEAALEANGLAVAQGLGEAQNGQMAMDTMLIHTSGQFITSRASIPLPKSDPQGYGSATTYLRRYALAAMMGIVQEDDDGNAGSGSQRQDNRQPEMIDDAQFAQLATLADQGGADLQKLCAFYQISALKNLPASKFEHCRASLQSKLTKKAAA